MTGIVSLQDNRAEIYLPSGWCVPEAAVCANGADGDCVALRDSAGSCVTYEVFAQLLVARYRNYKKFEHLVGTIVVSGKPVTRHLAYAWIGNIAQMLVPVAEACRAAALSSNILSCANRSIRVKGAASRRLWVYEGRVEAQSVCAPFGSSHIIWFRATPDRLGAYARRELLGFKGILQALPSTGYDGFTQDAGVTIFGCWRQIERQARSWRGRPSIL